MDPASSSSAAHFEALFHQAPAGYLMTGTDGIILEVNDAFLEWAGLSRTAVQGTSLMMLLPVGDRLMYTSHALPQLEVHGEYAELAVDFVGQGGSRFQAMLAAKRSVPACGEPAVDRIIVFSGTTAPQL